MQDVAELGAPLRAVEEPLPGHLDVDRGRRAGRRRGRRGQHERGGQRRGAHGVDRHRHHRAGRGGARDAHVERVRAQDRRRDRDVVGRAGAAEERDRVDRVERCGRAGARASRPARSCPRSRATHTSAVRTGGADAAGAGTGGAAGSGVGVGVEPPVWAAAGAVRRSVASSPARAARTTTSAVAGTGRPRPANLTVGKIPLPLVRPPTGLADGLALLVRYQAALPGFAPGTPASCRRRHPMVPPLRPDPGRTRRRVAREDNDAHGGAARALCSGERRPTRRGEPGRAATVRPRENLRPSAGPGARPRRTARRRRPAGQPRRHPRRHGDRRRLRDRRPCRTRQTPEALCAILGPQGGPAAARAGAACHRGRRRGRVRRRELGEGAILGDQSFVRERSTIGPGSVVGRGSVVDNDVTDRRARARADERLPDGLLGVEDDVFVGPGA